MSEKLTKLRTAIEKLDEVSGVLYAAMKAFNSKDLSMEKSMLDDYADETERMARKVEVILSREESYALTDLKRRDRIPADIKP